jgi:hypothetical protein
MLDGLRSGKASRYCVWCPVHRTRSARWFAVPVGGHSYGMRFGNLEVRPLGGGLGCLFMVLFSVVASVVLTVLVNLLLR